MLSDKEILRTAVHVCSTYGDLARVATSNRDSAKLRQASERAEGVINFMSVIGQAQAAVSCRAAYRKAAS